MKDDSKIVKTVCNLCFARCGIDCVVEQGHITKIYGMLEHPLNNLCIKSQAIPHMVYAKDRLTAPLKKENGRFKELTWDKALTYISDKLADIRERYGAASVVVNTGSPLGGSHAQKVARRFCDLFGTPNYTSGAAFCFLARNTAFRLTCGGYLPPHICSATQCMVMWGHNPTESFPILADTIFAMRKRGAKLIVIDPRTTPLAKEADIHARIRPGTDGALALGMLNVIIEEGLYDKEFVEQWTVGFKRLANHVKNYPPSKVEKITWVPAHLIVDMAKLYAKSRPASIAVGVSPEHCTNGIQAIRAMASMIAITGNADEYGGNLLVPGFRQTNLRVEDKASKDVPVGKDYPLFTEVILETSVSPLTESIITEEPYPIKALLVDGANPVVMWPNTNKVIRAFKKLDLLVVMDMFMTKTAEMADVILPATTFLETVEVRDYVNRGIPLIALSNKVIEPIGNSMEDWRIWAELGRRAGYAEYFPWQTTRQLLEYLLSSTNVSLDLLEKNPGGIFYAEHRFRKYLSAGFGTPSGKVELYSEIMDRYGYDPIPTYHEPAESPISRSELTDKYPLLLITGPTTRTYVHSRFRNLDILRNLEPEPVVEINPETAGKIGIADGDLVNVESLRGNIKLKAKVTDDIFPGVVSVQRGWSEANSNYLTDDEKRDPVSSYLGFRSVLCRVSKV